jgi:hypothetical protein
LIRSDQPGGRGAPGASPEAHPGSQGHSGVEARSAASRIQGFIDAITSQLGWLVQLPWSEEPDERRRIDALRLLRQVPAIVSLTLVDGTGRERLYVPRIGLNRAESRTNLSGEAAVVGARTARIWYGEVDYYRGSEPYLTVAISGNRPSVGIGGAEVNLKLIRDVITAIKIGETGYTFVLDSPGRLVAHPDISLALRGADDATLEPFQAIREAVVRAGTGFATSRNAEGDRIAVAAAPDSGPDWTVSSLTPKPSDPSMPPCGGRKASSGPALPLRPCSRSSLPA